MSSARACPKRSTRRSNLAAMDGERFREQRAPVGDRPSGGRRAADDQRVAVAQRLAATVALVRLRIGAEGIQVFQVALVGEGQVVGVHAVFREQLPVGLDRMLEAAGDDLQFRLGLVADQVDIVLRLAQVGFRTVAGRRSG